ncbi:MAG: prepilin-type N-terminal cleavage/methylation domain-containing protein [Phycisphaerae bacterium]
MSRRRAFTLIELLVVVAIISLLLSILLPSLQAGRRQARLAQCVSNMRQIKVAALMYTSDNRGYFAQTMETVSAPTPQTVSWWAINNYQAALDRYISPDRGGVTSRGETNHRRNVWFDPGDPDLEIPVMWGSFSDNGLITGVPRRESDLRSPARTVYSTLRHGDWSAVVGIDIPNPPPVGDSNNPFWVSEYFDMCFDPWADTADASNPYFWTRGRAAPPRAMFPSEPHAADWDRQIDGRFGNALGQPTRYPGGQPFAFCDGHVAVMPFEKTYAFVDGNMWSVR